MDFGLYILSAFCACVFLATLPFIIYALVFLKKKYKKIAIGIFVTILGWSSVAWRLTYQVHFLDEKLWGAVFYQDSDKVKEYLERGADPNTNFEGDASFSLAKKNGNNEIELLLIGKAK